MKGSLSLLEEWSALVLLQRKELKKNLGTLINNWIKSGQPWIIREFIKDKDIILYFSSLICFLALLFDIIEKLCEKPVHCGCMVTGQNVDCVSNSRHCKVSWSVQ